MEVSISNVINVNIADLPSTLQGDNINVIGIYTNEKSNFPINNYKIYQNAESVAKDFGLNSKTYKIVSTIYNQSLNIQAGNGYVVVIPQLDNVEIEAKSGELTCFEIIKDFFINVDNGSFKIALNGGTATVVSGLDFTNIKNVEDIAKVISDKFEDENINCVISTNNNNIIFTSGTAGATSTVEIISDTTGTDLTTVNYLNVAQAESKVGQANYTGIERVQDTYERSKKFIFYEAIITTEQETKDNIEVLAGLIQSQNKVALFVFNDLEKALEICESIKNKSYTKTRILYYGDSEYCNQFMAGYISKALSIDFNGNNTVYNLHIKEIVGIEADKTIDDDVLNQLKSMGVDCYVNIKGLGCIFTSGENDFIDNVIFKNWLKNSLEVAGFNCLRTANVVPQTEKGMDTLKTSYQSVLEQAKIIGYVNGGEWNLPIIIGDNETVFKNNIRNFGYYIYSIPVAQQTRADRERRKATAISIGVKTSGAINSSDVLVYVNY